MSVEDEFSGLAFALGSVRGTRSFEVDKLGRLRGIYYRQTWTPGENLAECRKRDEYDAVSFAGNSFGGVIQNHGNLGSYVPSSQYGSQSQYPVIQYYAIQPPVIEETNPPSSPKPHDLEGCQHGFYAYYDGSDDHHSGVRVTGVIEGYGETLIGTRGFRCMKARIVALCITEETVRGHLVARNYSDIPQFATVRDMLSEYPTDDNGQGLSPESDPDFWTRNF